MVEAGAKQVSEAEVLGAIEFGHECCKKIAAGIRQLVKLAGKPKREFTSPSSTRNSTPPSKRPPPWTSPTRSIRRSIRSWKATPAWPRCAQRVIEPIPDDQKAEAGKCYDALKERIFRDEMLRRTAAARMAARSTRSGPSPSKPACCRVLTVLRCSPAAKPRRWSPSRRHQGRRTAHRTARAR